MATQVQKAIGTVTSGTSLTVTLPSAPTLGNLLIAVFRLSDSVLIFTDALGFYNDSGVELLGNTSFILVGHKEVVGGDGTSWTFTFSGALSGSVVLYEYSDMGVSGGRGIVNTATSVGGTSSTPSVGSITTTAASTLHIGGIGNSNGNVIASSFDNGYTHDTSQVHAGLYLDVAIRDLNSAGAYNSTGTFAGSYAYEGVHVAFEELNISKSEAVTDGFGISDALEDNSVDETASDTLNASDIITDNQAYSHALADAMGLSDSGSIIRGVVETLIETLQLNELLEPQQVLELIDAFRLGETTSTNVITADSVSESIAFNDALALVWFLVASENLTLNDTIISDPLKALSIADALVLSGVVNTYNIAVAIVAAAVGLNSVTAYSFDGVLAETLAASDSLSDILLAAGLAEEALTLADTNELVLRASLIVTDAVAIDDAQSTNAILSSLLEEGFIFTVDFRFDDASYKGWVMNSENFAISNYTNYPFTGFAVYEDKYYGVKTDGVYLLEGTLDESDYITATIRTAALDFGTSNLKTVTQAYLGFDATGTIVLKVIANNDYETWYTLDSSTTGPHLDRLKLAKGIEARYWQFELNTQDSTKLDLDTLELFPIVLKRKL